LVNTFQPRLVTFLSQNSRWLAAGGLLTFLSSFGQTSFISIFAAQIQSDFNLTHGNWGAIYSVGTAASAAVMIWAGSLTDHWRARSLGIMVLTLLAASCLAMAINPLAGLLPFVIFALRLTGQGMCSQIAVVSMARWFVATRGKALAIATLGFSIGEAVLPITFVALLTIIPWRSLWIVAAVIAIFSIPILLKLLRTERTPQSMASDNQHSGMLGQHWDRKSTLFHPLFWLVVPAILGISAFNTAFFFHQVYFAEVKGWSHLAIVSLFPVYTVVGIIAMFISGMALDRFGTSRLMPIYQLPMIFAFLIFAKSTSLFQLSVGFVFLAISSGANSTIPTAFWAEFFGTRYIGSIKAMATAVMVLGSAIGPGLTGLLIDFKIDITMQYIGVAVYFIIASLLVTVGIHHSKKDLPNFL
jgi:MFS family permease